MRLCQKPIYNMLQINRLVKDISSHCLDKIYQNTKAKYPHNKKVNHESRFYILFGLYCLLILV